MTNYFIYMENNIFKFNGRSLKGLSAIGPTLSC